MLALTGSRTGSRRPGFLIVFGLAAGLGASYRNPRIFCISPKSDFFENFSPSIVSVAIREIACCSSCVRFVLYSHNREICKINILLFLNVLRKRLWFDPVEVVLC